MTTLEILTHPHETLAAKAEDLTKADILSNEIQTLIEDMKDTCHIIGGLGLAANQVGSTANLCIYSTPGETGFKVLINPRLVGRMEKFSSKGEGCLSLPEQYFNVPRYKKLRVTGLDGHAKPIDIITKSKHLAKILMHELDHLKGITIIDKGKKVS
jgi:peptide deformylase